LATQPLPDTEALLEQLAAHLDRKATPARLRWIHATVGQALRLISVDEIDFLRSDEKYTLIAWRGDAGKPGEALIRTPLKELVEQLDPAHFVQVHRSVVVNLRAISHVTRGENETRNIHLKGREDVLPVSRTYLHLFGQM
jgi:DNA-binding LytR/AlgR family response regulator